MAACKAHGLHTTQYDIVTYRTLDACIERKLAFQSPARPLLRDLDLDLDLDLERDLDIGAGRSRLVLLSRVRLTIKLVVWLA